MLIDHGSKINIMSSDSTIVETSLSRKTIDGKFRWQLKKLNISTKHAPSYNVGDVFVDQKFFVQEKFFYQLIRGQSYITTIRMETKVIDNGHNSMGQLIPNCQNFPSSNLY